MSFLLLLNGKSTVKTTIFISYEWVDHIAVYNHMFRPLSAIVRLYSSCYKVKLHNMLIANKYSCVLTVLLPFSNFVSTQRGCLTSKQSFLFQDIPPYFLEPRLTPSYRINTLKTCSLHRVDISAWFLWHTCFGKYFFRSQFLRATRRVFSCL